MTEPFGVRVGELPEESFLRAFVRKHGKDADPQMLHRIERRISESDE